MKKVIVINAIISIALFFTVLTLSGCFGNEQTMQREAKKSYDTWFYCWAETYNGKPIHIDSRIKSVNFKSSPNVFGEMQIDGLFIVGHGQINSYDYYYVYREIGPDMYELVKMPANETKILETDKISPSIAAEYDFEYDEQLYFDWEHDEYSFTKNNLIIVPKGSIIQKFNM